MRILVALIAACTLGCWLSHREFAEEDGSADAAPPRSCPTSAPTGGPVRLHEVWRHVSAGLWVDPGSAGVAVTGDTLLIGVPHGGGDLTVQPRLLRLDARTGRLRSAPEEGVPGLGGATAVAAIGLDEFAEFVGAKPTEGAGTVTFAGMLIDAEGTEHDGWQRSDLGAFLGTGTARDLRVAGAGIPAEDQVLFLAVEMDGGPSSPWSLHRLVVPWGETGIDAGPLAPAIAGTDDRGELHVAAGIRRDPDDPLPSFWGEPEAVAVHRLLPTSNARTPLPTGPPAPHRSSPVAATPPGGPRAFLVAFRAAPGETDPPAIRIEERTSIDGELPVHRSSTLAELEPIVDTPEPAALEGDGLGFVLAWTARREPPGGGSVPACLYLTPLTADTEAAGLSIRIDSDAPSGEITPIDHVRIVTAEEAVYVLWRQGTDLVVVRYDGSA